MNKIFYTLLLFFILTNSTFSQAGICGTHDHEEIFERLEANKRFLHENPAFARNNDVLYVPVKFHIVTKDDGTGGLEQEAILTQLCRLNKDYEALKMQFYIKGDINYIPYSILFDDPRHSFSTIRMAANFANNAMNVFIVNKIGTNNTGTTLGYYQPGRDWIVMIQSKVGSNETLSHEVGHFFSLPHTFFGWEGCPYESSVHGLQVNLTHVPCSGELIELANGSNCNQAADKLCDTPPDFNFGLYDPEQNCKLDFEVRDINGDVVKPMENNFMSYFSNCPTNQFSPTQMSLMRTDYNTSGRSYIRSGYIPDTTLLADQRPAISEPLFNSTVPYYDHIFVNWSDVEGAGSYLLKVTVGTINKQVFYYKVVGKSETVLTDLPPNQSFVSLLIWPFNEGNSCDSKVSETHRFKIGGTSVDIEDIETSGQFLLYPNPVSVSNPKFILDNKGETGQYQIEIFNLNGQKITAETRFIRQGKNILDLSSHMLEQGLFIFRIIHGDVIYNQKLMLK